MTGTQALSRSVVRHFGICICAAALLTADVRSANAVVKIFDGFGDADRNNDGTIGILDTDWNDSGTFNEFTGTPPNATGADATLANRGITEVTAATDASDVGIKWSGIRSYDSATNLVKSKLKIINDNVNIGVEGSGDIHNDGLALGIESRGGGSSFIGNFGQSIVLGPNAGDRVVASFDWRVWREANDNVSQPSSNNELRWGLYQDTDNEFGQTANYGDGWFNNGGGTNGAPVMWGRDDGKWFDSSPGAEGDKGINTALFFGQTAFTTDARIRWETNVLNINGGTNNARILEGTAPVNPPTTGGGDTSTVATPPGDGLGGVITDLSSFVPHNLKLEIVRLADGLVQVATFVDNVELLRDEIKTTDTGYGTIAPIPFSYDYVAIRNALNDWDYVIDNFKVEVFNTGDFNDNGVVDAADYVLWRENVQPLANEVSTIGTTDAQDYTDWRARFGSPGPITGAGGEALGAVPEPAGVAVLLIGGLLASGFRRSGCSRRATRA